MYEPLPSLDSYDVSPVNGFLPTNPPSERLADTYYSPWESVVANLHALMITKRIHGVVDRLPVLSTDFFRSEAEWRRAYSILGFIVHGYVWSGETPTDVIPPPISIPFLQTCEHLELPPVATYAGLVLWNWKPLLPEEPVDNLENLYTLHTLTGSMDETWFYTISCAIEARGAPLIPLMLDAVDAVRHGDEQFVTEALRSFAERIDELCMLLDRMYDNCDPHIFYHRIRPLLAGSKNMAEAGLPRGVLFDTGSGDDDYVQYSGGSNAQSSIIQFFDIILGVVHRPTGDHAPSTSAKPTAPGQDAPASSPGHNFIHAMRPYMPGPHRRFLSHVERIANIRSFVVDRAAENPALRIAYDACLGMIRAFRDVHIRMVSRYIVVKSREASTAATAVQNVSSKRMNLAVASSTSTTEGPARKLKGTGGTSLIPFLKQARDETGEPAIDAWARRLLNNGPGVIMNRGSRDYTFGTPAKKVPEKKPEREIVGLAGVWTVDDSEGGICHW